VTSGQHAVTLSERTEFFDFSLLHEYSTRVKTFSPATVVRTCGATAPNLSSAGCPPLLFPELFGFFGHRRSDLRPVNNRWESYRPAVDFFECWAVYLKTGDRPFSAVAPGRAFGVRISLQQRYDPYPVPNPRSQCDIL